MAISKSCWFHLLNRSRICSLCIEATAPPGPASIISCLDSSPCSRLCPQPVPHMCAERSCEHLSRATYLRLSILCGFTTSCDKSRSSHPRPGGSYNLPSHLCPQHLPRSPSLTCSSHRGLSLFPSQPDIFPATALAGLFLLPGMLFPWMSASLTLASSGHLLRAASPHHPIKHQNPPLPAPSWPSAFLHSS